MDCTLHVDSQEHDACTNQIHRSILFPQEKYLKVCYSHQLDSLGYITDICTWIRFNSKGFQLLPPVRLLQLGLMHFKQVLKNCCHGWKAAIFVHYVKMITCSGWQHYQSVSGTACLSCTANIGLFCLVVAHLAKVEKIFNLCLLSALDAFYVTSFQKPWFTSCV